MDALTGRWTPLLPAKIASYGLALVGVGDYIIKFGGKNI
jgi:hypothetical protein